MLSLSSGTPLALKSPPPAKTPAQPDRIFGDWGGMRSWLSNRGVDVGLGYLSENAWDVAGGMARGGTYAGQEELSVDLDWNKIANLTGFSTHVDFVSRQGQNVSAKYVGDVLIQAQEIFYPLIDNQPIHLVYFYLEQKLYGDNIDLKAGRLPVIGDFASLPAFCDFMALTSCDNRGLNANLGWTAPVANWGGVAEFKIAGPLSFKIGAYEVNTNMGGPYGFDWGLNGAVGVLIPAEFEWHAKLGPQQLPGLYEIGGGYDTSQYADWLTAVNGLPLPLTTASPQTNQRGSFYVLAQQTVWQDYLNHANNLVVLGGYEYNTPVVSVIQDFAFLGVVDNGPFPGRPDDYVGFEVTYARVSPYLTDVQELQTALALPLSNSAPGVETYEWVLELDYRMKLYPGLYLMPDLQYVIRPSAASTYPNAWVAGFKITAMF